MAKNSIPKWILVSSTGLTCLGLFVGLSLYISPGSFIPNLNLSFANTSFLVQMWGARQIAIAAMIGFSAYKKSVAMLQASLGAYFLMTFQDIFIGIVHKDTDLIVGTLFFCILSGSMLNRLRKS